MMVFKKNIVKDLMKQVMNLSLQDFIEFQKQFKNLIKTHDDLIKRLLIEKEDDKLINECIDNK